MLIRCKNWKKLGLKVIEKALLNACFSSFFCSEIVEQFHEIFGEWPAPKIVAVEENEVYVCYVLYVLTYMKPNGT